MRASEFPPDGILGLGFPSLSDFHGQSPLFHTLFNEGKLSQPVFSLKLTASGAELYIGGMNEALYIDSTLVYTPVTNPVSASTRR
jgi:cathepsin D